MSIEVYFAMVRRDAQQRTTLETGQVGTCDNYSVSVFGNRDAAWPACAIDRRCRTT